MTNVFQVFDPLAPGTAVVTDDGRDMTVFVDAGGLMLVAHDADGVTFALYRGTFAVAA